MADVQLMACSCTVCVGWSLNEIFFLFLSPNGHIDDVITFFSRFFSWIFSAYLTSWSICDVTVANGITFFFLFSHLFSFFLMNSPRTNQYFPMPFNIIDPQFHSIPFFRVLCFCFVCLLVGLRAVCVGSMLWNADIMTWQHRNVGLLMSSP